MHPYSVFTAVVPFDILAETGQYFPFATVFNSLLGILFLMNIWWFYVSTADWLACLTEPLIDLMNILLSASSSSGIFGSFM